MARSIDAHKPDCSCPVCSAPEREEPWVHLGFRVPASLRDAVRARGGSEWARRVLAEAVEQDPTPPTS